MNFLVVVDNSGRDSNLQDIWEKSGFVKRVESLGFPVALLDPSQTLEEKSWQNVQSLSEAIDAGSGAKAVIHIGTDQVFFDHNIALKGIRKFRDLEPDVFTQWEHCRLPIGVGIRIIAMQALNRSGSDSIEAFLDAVLVQPENFIIRYDDHMYVEDSSYNLDSRYSQSTASLTNTASNWSLDGFMEIADAETHRFIQKKYGTRFDERGMAVPYGFESRECGKFPSYVMFDLTNRCNAACIHCPQSIGFKGQDETVFLDLAAFQRVVDECVGKTIQFVRITADGEPLLHPNIWEMLDYAKEKNVGPVGLTTNGSALNDRNARRLINSNAFMVDISLDAYSEETFEIVRAGLSFERTKSNVFRLLELREEMSSPLKVMVSFVKQKENVHEVSAFQDYWGEHVDKVLIREMISNVGVNNISGSSKDFDGRRWPCPHLWRRVVINYDSLLKACPIDWQKGLVNKAVTDSAVIEQWHDNFYHDYRMQHLNNTHKESSICRTCRDWQGTPWNLGYEKVIGSLQEDS